MEENLNSKVKICENHLPDLYKALQDENVQLVKQVEHQLTSSEECVACAYLLKAEGPARRVLSDFLVKGGFCISSKSSTSIANKLAKLGWGFKVGVFLVIFALFYSLLLAARSLFFSSNQSSVFGVVVTLIFSLIVFILLDDRFLN